MRCIFLIIVHLCQSNLLGAFGDVDVLEDVTEVLDFGDEAVEIVSTSSVVRRGTAATLTCKFTKLDSQIEILWTDKNGAKVGVYGPSTKDDFTQTTEAFDEKTNSQQGILIVQAHAVKSTTTFECEIGAGAVPAVRTPSPSKLDLGIYDIIGNNRKTIVDTQVTLKCTFAYVTHKPDQVYWETEGVKYCSHQSSSTCKTSEVDNPDSRNDETQYIVDGVNEGSALYSATGRSLVTTLTIAGSANTADKQYTCGVLLPELEPWTLELSVDTFKVKSAYKEVRSYTDVTLSCHYTDMSTQLEIYWSQGRGGERLTAENSGNFLFQMNYDAYQGWQSTSLTIPKDFNQFSADFFCSVFDIDVYRDTKVSLGVFHMETNAETYQVGVAVTFTVSISSLRYPLTIVWRNSQGFPYSKETPGPFEINNGVWDAESNTQQPQLIVPGTMNKGTFSLTCEVIPNPCQGASECDNEVAADGTEIDNVPGVVEVQLIELKNTGYQCSIETFNTLRSETQSDTTENNIPKPCFTILRVEPDVVRIYPIYQGQTYVSPGNNLEVAPLPIYMEAFGGNFVYRCTYNGWDRNPPGCGSVELTDNIPAGACSTQDLFHPLKYKVLSGFEVPDPDYSTSDTPSAYYTHISNDTEVEYTIRNTDCYEFVFNDDAIASYGDENGEVLGGNFSTKCVNGQFSHKIIPVTKVCCGFPEFIGEDSSIADLCVKSFLDTPGENEASSEGVDMLTGVKYLKNDRSVYFDKKCPCFSIHWDEATCHKGNLISKLPVSDLPKEVQDNKDRHTWVTLDDEEVLVLDKVFVVESFCCKIPQNYMDTGHPTNDMGGVRYVYRDKLVTFTCRVNCFRIKEMLRTATCTKDTPVLESPKCEPDPTCCKTHNETNPFITNLQQITWENTENGDKEKIADEEVNVTRRCYFSEWDLVHYSGIDVDHELVEHTLDENKPGTETTITEAGTEPGAGEGSDSAQDSETEQAVSDSDSEGDVSDSTLEEDVSIASDIVNCAVLEQLLSVNLTLEETVSALSYLYDYSFNISEKSEKVHCYNALRYVLWDPWHFGYSHKLDLEQINRLIITAANVIDTWTSTVSEGLSRKYAYTAIKVKTDAKAFASSKLIYNNWLIDLRANLYVKTSFSWAMQNNFFPDTSISDIISPVTWVDLPQNATIPNTEQFIVVNFTSTSALSKDRHYSCGVYDFGVWGNEALEVSDYIKWSRGPCTNVSVEEFSVICKCTGWRMFLAVTQTRNYSSSLFGNLTVGDAAGTLMLKIQETLPIAAIGLLAVTFLIITQAETKRKPLMQCRLHVISAMIGTHILTNLAFWMRPANISCVYMLYIFETFSLATILWFPVEFICLRNFIRGKSDSDLKPSKKYSQKMTPIVYVMAFIVPSAFMAVNKITSVEGTLLFGQPFDAQSCWFNQDMEFLFLTVPQLGYILVGIVVYVMLVITNITAKEGARDDVLGSGLVFFSVIVTWVLFALRSNLYIDFIARFLLAAQGLITTIGYVALGQDIKESLLPGCFGKEADDSHKLLK